MTENERLTNGDKEIPTLNDNAEYWLQVYFKLKDYEAIGTIEEFKALKEKNEPMQLAEHNFQDEPHHYLCPVCRNIVSCTQNYCEECGQALEN